MFVLKECFKRILVGYSGKKIIISTELKPTVAEMVQYTYYVTKYNI